MKGLGKRLKQARVKRGLTQTQAGDAVGISYGTLSGYERDYRNPDHETLLKLSELYQVSVSWLLGAEEFNSTNTEKRTQSEEELLTVFRSLSDEGKAWLRQSIEIIKQARK